MYYVGLDLGQRHDPTAIAVVERIEMAQAWQATEFHSPRVRHLERAPLGTPYPGVVARVREIVQKLQKLGACALAVDGTGVGAPVVDMLRAARIGCHIAAVTITGGEKQRNNGAGWSVPKRDLLSLVQVLLERNDLRLAKGLRELGPMCGPPRAPMGASGWGGRVRRTRRPRDCAGAGLLAGAETADRVWAGARAWGQLVEQ
jgi:hypothetical protein